MNDRELAKRSRDRQGVPNFLQGKRHRKRMPSGRRPVATDRESQRDAKHKAKTKIPE